MTILLWVIFVVGPAKALPLYHYRPVTYSTEERCQMEISRLTATGEFVSNDPAFSLECRAIPDLSGEPA
jgi:hypothetical protein